MHRLISSLLFVSAAFGQWEIGADIGYGWYRNGTIFGPGVSAHGGVRNRFAAGLIVAQQANGYISGEFRYLFHDGHPFLELPGIKQDIQGQSHTLTYELLFHLNPSESRVRPFVAGGAGAKGYIVAGPEPFPQPTREIGTLVANDVWKVVFSVGGGVKFRLLRRVATRVEFRDYLTTFPRGQIVPAANTTARGIFQQFTPLFGLSYLF